MINLIGFGIELAIVLYALWVGIGAYVYTKRARTEEAVDPADFIKHISAPLIVVKEKGMHLWSGILMFIERRM